MARAMPREGIQGDEWTAYLTLGRTTRTYHGIAYRARAPGRRRANSSRGSNAPPGSPGKPGAGRSGSGDLDSSDEKVCGMQNAETLLGVLRERGRRGLPLQRLYRQLFNPQLYLMAYQRLYSNAGAMTPGVTGETVDGMSLDKIRNIIAAVRAERWRWRPVKRTYIPKRDGKRRALGLPGWSDKLLRGGALAAQRVLRRAVLRPVPWVPPRTWLPHRFECGGRGLERDSLVHRGRYLPMLSTRLTTRSCCRRWARRSTITGSCGWSRACSRPGTWRTGGGTPRSAAVRRVGWHHPSSATSTWAGWTSSSRRSCCRSTTGVSAGHRTLPMNRSRRPSARHANAVPAPRCGHYASTAGPCPARIFVILATVGCATSGTPTTFSSVSAGQKPKRCRSSSGVASSCATSSSWSCPRRRR